MSESSFGSEPSPAAGGSIVVEFRCVACSKLLKVSAAGGGRQAKCPACGVVQAVPPPEQTAGSAGVFAAPSAVGIDSYGRLPGSPLSGAGPVPPAADPFARPPAAEPFSRIPPPRPVPSAPAAIGDSSDLVIADVRPAGGLAARRREGSVTPTKQLFDRITAEIAKIYVGQDELVLGTLVALFSSGHVLIESVPGLGKTLFVRTLGQVLGCRFGRVQFTADLMPSDITGAPIFDMKIQEFRFRHGPIFTQLLLADEINRSPAKTHAALLEIMQEYRVTVDGVSHEIERPFLVLATQNPIESEGTYNLPEAQLDRFMFKLVADYPAAGEEAEILTLHSRQVDINQRLKSELATITSPAEIIEITRANSDVQVDRRLIDYINSIVRLTRDWPQFHMGASPRAGIALMQGARTLAAFSGRDYAVPDDVVELALPALRHRVILTAEAEVEGHRVDDLLQNLIRSVEVPRL